MTPMDVLAGATVIAPTKGQPMHGAPNTQLALLWDIPGDGTVTFQVSTTKSLPSSFYPELEEAVRAIEVWVAAVSEYY